MPSDLRKALRKDKELYYAYQSNIAMAFVDSVYWYKKKTGKKVLSKKDYHKIANDAAINFLDLFISANKNEKREDKIDDILS